MRYKEIQINSRVQVDVENSEDSNTTLETYRGIVSAMSDESMDMVTDFGKLVQIRIDDILSVTKISFDRNIATSIMNIKKYFKEREELEDRLSQLIGKEDGFTQNVLDANMLSRFNITGAKNRLAKSMDESLFHFTRNRYLYCITLTCNDNDQIELDFKVSSIIEHYLNDIDMEKLIRTHAPNELDVIVKSFNGLGDVSAKKSNVAHIEDQQYNVFSLYKMCVDVDENNFIDIRNQLTKGLMSLRR